MDTVFTRLKNSWFNGGVKKMEKETSVYCMKCRDKVTSVLSVEEKKTSKGIKYLWTGKCPNCGTKVCKMGKSGSV